MDIYQKDVEGTKKSKGWINALNEEILCTSDRHGQRRGRAGDTWGEEDGRGQKGRLLRVTRNGLVNAV